MSATSELRGAGGLSRADKVRRFDPAPRPVTEDERSGG